MAGIEITAAICTHNRAEMFTECLAALMPQTGPGSEVIAVDSASDPDQAAIVAEAATAYPSVHSTRLGTPEAALARMHRLFALNFAPSIEHQHFLRSWYDFGWLQETLPPRRQDGEI